MKTKYLVFPILIIALNIFAQNKSQTEFHSRFQNELGSLFNEYLMDFHSFDDSLRRVLDDRIEKVKSIYKLNVDSLKSLLTSEPNKNEFNKKAEEWNKKLVYIKNQQDSLCDANSFFCKSDYLNLLKSNDGTADIKKSEDVDKKIELIDEKFDELCEKNYSKLNKIVNSAFKNIKAKYDEAIRDLTALTVTVEKKTLKIPHRLN